MKLATKEFPSSEKQRKQGLGGGQVAGEVIGQKKAKEKKQKGRGGGNEERWEFFFFEWNPMAGPDGEERRAWRAPVSAAPKEDVMRLHG